MFFWIKTIALYLLVACGSMASAFALSFLSISPFATDDSPGLGILWALLFVVMAAILVPLGLALTAELVERAAQGRKFSFPKLVKRFALALIISVGPVYHAVCVYPYVEGRRPTYYIEKEDILYCLSGVSAALALRIKRAPIRYLTM